MPPPLQKQPKSNQVALYSIYFVLLVWMGFVSWPLICPYNWFSIPVFLCLGYAVFRLLFEMTINRNQHSPTIATCFASRHKTAHLLKQEADKSKKEPYNIVDLGSGRGELARCLAKKIRKANVLGIEMAPFPFWQSVLVQKVFGPQNLSFQQCDFWSFDCSDIDAITLYLGPLTAQRVGEKLHKEIKQGSVVISQTYPLEGPWISADVVTVYSPFKEKIYVYKR